MSKKVRREIRQEMKRILTRLDDRWIEAASRELCNNLSHIIDTEIGRDIEHVLAWVAFFPGEVDLSSFISEQIGKRRVYLPRVLPDKSMNFLSIGDDWLSSMTAGGFGIPEPSQEESDLGRAGRGYNSADAESTLIIVPGLAFDKDGNRLGRGGGYYDRFLGRGPILNSVKIGVCWSLQLVHEIPPESHDVGMDWVCHERNYLKTGIAFADDLDE